MHRIHLPAILAATMIAPLIAHAASPAWLQWGGPDRNFICKGTGPLATDWPDDVQCLGAGGPSESAACLEAPLAGQLVDEGGQFPVDTRGLPNNYEALCAGNAGGGEVVYALTLTRDSRVAIETINAT